MSFRVGRARAGEVDGERSEALCRRRRTRPHRRQVGLDELDATDLADTRVWPDVRVAEIDVVKRAIGSLVRYTMSP